MQIFREAFRVIEQNLRLAGVFVVLAAMLGLITDAVHYALENGLFGNLGERQESLVLLAARLAVVAAISALQAAVYALLGRQIDRPLYKVEGAWDGIRRFFTLWLLLNLIMLVIFRFLENTVAAENELAYLAYLLVFVYWIVQVPICACVMFMGRFRWQDFGESLKPLARHFEQTLGILLAGMLQFFMFDAILAGAGTDDPASLQWLYLSPLLSCVLGIMEVYIFSVTWLLCMLHRDTEDFDDMDF